MTLPFARPSFPEIYEQEIVGPLFRPYAGLLLDDVDLAAGDRLLDVACGTGIVARLAKLRIGNAGAVVGVDSSAPMLAVARRIAVNIDWREGDAAALPLHDGERFDVVVCQQGLQFFADKAAAVRQMRHAVADGGRLAVSTWRSDEESPVLHALRLIAEARLGPIVDRRHGFGEPGPVEALLRDAGFGNISSKIVSRTIRLDGPTFAHRNAWALIGMNARAKELGEEERDRLAAAIANDSADVVLASTDSEGFAFEIGANVTTAAG